MKRTILLSILVLLAGLQISLAQSGGRYQLVRIADATTAQLALLQTLDSDHRHVEQGEIVIALHESDIDRLRSAGVSFSVVIADMERFYAERARADLERLAKNPATRLLSDSTPANFSLGSVGGFYSLQELDSATRSMAALYPLLATSFTIGLSTEGREISGIRISSRADGDTTLPEVLYTAMHHAREPAGMMSLVYSMWRLLEGYGSDPEITWLLDNRALYFLPNVNPDGYNLNLEENPEGGGMWRRNMRALGDSGVDLNRNYGPMEYWDRQNDGSSVDPRSALYRGPAPFSEPETQAIRDFTTSRRFVVSLNHHAYSNLLVWPFNWSREPIADTAYYRTVSRQMTAFSGFAPGNDIVTVGYGTRGVSDEWFYSFGNPREPMISWSPESGSLDDGFWPLPSRIIPMAVSSWPMNLLAAAIAGDAPRVTGWERVDSMGRAMIRLTVTNLGRAMMTTTGSIGIEGGTGVAMIPALPPLGRVDLLLDLPDGVVTADSARPFLTLAIDYREGRFRQEIRPMVHPMEQVLADDFEAALFNWSADRWGIEYVEGRGNVIGDSPQRPYIEGSAANILQLASPLSLRGLNAAELAFDARWVILARYHEGSIEVRRTGDPTWEKLEAEHLQIPFIESEQLRTRLRGDRGDWNRYRINLDRHVGHEIDLRFVMYSPPAEVDTTFDGIMLDDLVITGTRSPSAVVRPDGQARRLALHLYPNPFGDHLDMHLENAGIDTRVEIVDALGRIVLRGRGNRLSFDTRDLPPGFYTAVATSRHGVVREKIVRMDN